MASAWYGRTVRVSPWRTWCSGISMVASGLRLVRISTMRSRSRREKKPAMARASSFW